MKYYKIYIYLILRYGRDWKRVENVYKEVAGGIQATMFDVTLKTKRLEENYIHWQHETYSFNVMLDLFIYNMWNVVDSCKKLWGNFLLLVSTESKPQGYYKSKWSQLWLALIAVDWSLMFHEYLVDITKHFELFLTVFTECESSYLSSRIGLFIPWTGRVNVCRVLSENSHCFTNLY